MPSVGPPAHPRPSGDGRRAAGVALRQRRRRGRAGRRLSHAGAGRGRDAWGQRDLEEDLIEILPGIRDIKTFVRGFFFVVMTWS